VVTHDLNPEQLAAVSHGEGPQLVLAGAGSGKTRVITYRIAHLVEDRGVDPSRIVAVTFTNKAAGEMRERVERLLALVPLPTFVGTFHRFALTLLRRWGERVGVARDFVILDAADQRGLIKQALADEQLSEKAFSPQAVLAAVSAAKNRLVDHQGYEAEARSFFEKRVARAFHRYQTLAKEASGLDFDDMIAGAVKLLEREPEVGERVRWRAQYLLVDEYQDTNFAQLRLIQLLSGPAGNLTAVGDEDQGIYRWRGAELANILEFERSFPGAVVRKLERNYRSTQTILDASGALVAHNRNRRGKRLWTDSGAGEPVELFLAADELDEARWAVATVERLAAEVPLEQVAILVRTNAQTRALEDELLRREVPYTLVAGVRFYERAEIKDLVAYLRVIRHPYDTLSLARIVNQPPRGIGKTTLDRLKETAGALGQPVWDVLYQEELGGFSARSAQALKAFRDLIVGLRQRAKTVTLPALIEELVAATRYAELYDASEPEGLAKRENIQELLSAAREFAEAHVGELPEEEMLTAFLDHASLMSDTDGIAPRGGVLVMTLHAAKGLEFEGVIVAGLEDGLLPHFNAQGAPEDLEEERRLLYVGMTRARRRLFLSCCRRRRIAGLYQDQRESPFLAEIPPQFLSVGESPALLSETRSAGVRSYFGRPGPAPTLSRPARRFAEAEPGATAGLQRGSRVRHPILGQGTVLELDGSGDGAKLTVFFDREGKRKLVARYANLELL
jgi:DNA helicase-2/ATP-dependent DNA helicase PcrA